MQKFLDDLLSIQWWFGVVLVGILIHLASAFLKPHIDSLLSSTSSWWTRHNDKRKKRFEESVANIRQNTLEETRALFGEMRNRMRSVHAMLAGVMSFLFGLTVQVVPEFNAMSLLARRAFPLVFFLLGTMLFGLSQLSYARAIEIKETIFAARKKNGNVAA